MNIKLRCFPSDFWIGFQIKHHDSAVAPGPLGTVLLRQRIVFIGVLPMLQIIVSSEPYRTVVGPPPTVHPVLIPASTAGSCNCPACQAQAKEQAQQQQNGGGQ